MTGWVTSRLDKALEDATKERELENKELKERWAAQKAEEKEKI